MVDRHPKRRQLFLNRIASSLIVGILLLCCFQPLFIQLDDSERAFLLLLPAFILCDVLGLCRVIFDCLFVNSAKPVVIFGLFDQFQTLVGLRSGWLAVFDFLVDKFDESIRRAGDQFAIHPIA